MWVYFNKINFFVSENLYVYLTDLIRKLFLKIKDMYL